MWFLTVVYRVDYRVSIQNSFESNLPVSVLYLLLHFLWRRRVWSIQHLSHTVFRNDTLKIKVKENLIKHINKFKGHVKKEIYHFNKLIPGYHQQLFTVEYLVTGLRIRKYRIVDRDGKRISTRGF